MSVEIHGYALVSADDAIADAEGAMPPSLRNDADWAYFQAGLDLADLVALGRASHAATPNPRGRRRLVLSRSAQRLERRPDGFWWNPQALAWEAALARLLPEGGRVAVPGGQAAFELFLPAFTAFHLSRAHSVRLPGGRGLFAACERGTTAERVLAGAGLVAQPSRWLDEVAEVSLRVFSRPHGDNLLAEAAVAASSLA